MDRRTSDAEEKAQEKEERETLVPKVIVEVLDVTIDDSPGVKLVVECVPPINGAELGDVATPAQQLGLRIGEYAQRLIAAASDEDQPDADDHAIDCDSLWNAGPCSCAASTPQKAN